ncbi:hypothetical protein EXN66_Car008162 [Channa argus]|uniref:Uncharacterized protein n=1 Tax=Channa argus TaxID=215402 RepID=A0A6G1PR63_CHAAH|nr:hypothetical protein EXN66_Car008162 [Channa argus]
MHYDIFKGVLESSVLLEHLRQGARRKTGDSHRPDGASVPRSIHQYPNHERHELLPLTLVKLRPPGTLPHPGRFGRPPRGMEWRGNSYSSGPGSGRSCLASACRPSTRGSSGAPSYHCCSQTALQAVDFCWAEQLAGRYRQGGESLGVFAADVQLYTQRSYPTFLAAAREELSLHSFLRRLAPERLRQHVRLATPQSLKEAERAEEASQGSQLGDRW